METSLGNKVSPVLKGIKEEREGGRKEGRKEGKEGGRSKLPYTMVWICLPKFVLPVFFEV
jgi:hypothetical protein